LPAAVVVRSDIIQDEDNQFYVFLRILSSTISHAFSPILDAFKSKIHTTLNDATTNAIKAVGGGSNSSAVAAFIHPERGFLVYDVFVLDSSNNIHRVIVDPGNGKVLSNQPMSWMDTMSMMHPSMGMGMMMGQPHV
jgi:hypothetical protein